MRNLILVLNQIITLIPNAGHNEFKEKLEKIRYKASCAAPEIMCSMWHDTQLVISNHFENIDVLPEWGVEFIKIWTDKTDQ